MAFLAPPSPSGTASRVSLFARDLQLRLRPSVTVTAVPAAISGGSVRLCCTCESHSPSSANNGPTNEASFPTFQERARSLNNVAYPLFSSSSQSDGSKSAATSPVSVAERADSIPCDDGDNFQRLVSDHLAARVRRYGPSFLVGTCVALSLAFGLPRAAQAKADKPLAPPPTPIVGRQTPDGGKAGGKEAAESTRAQAEEQERAVKMLEDFLAKHPRDVTALRMLLRVRMKCADFAGGIKILDQLVEIEPDDMEWKYIRAQAQEFVGDLQAARKGFQDILKVDPFSARALQGLATVMRRSGEDSLVLGMVEEAVGKAGQAGKQQEATNLKMLLGQLHALQGNVEAAIAQYDAISASDPSDFRPYLCKGLVFSLMGDTKQADAHFKEFRRRCPKNYASYLDNMLVKSTVEARRQEVRSSGEF
ncbi:unnamed protein product [Closterium sp. NIES-64]|nr:unnamed protein product [Closterium sp. NIES-64]CAI6009422.1 unnamed protein product [Closterium sp. NIES-65]